VKVVHLDYETRSTLNLKDCGLDRYMKHPSTQPLMCAYAFDDGPVKMWCCWTGEKMPDDLHAALLDPTIKKGAWNYNFERDCTEYKAGIPIPQGEWFDPSVLCASMSLPIGLDRAARALGVTQKMGEGKKYVKMFSSPTKATKKMLKNGSPEFYFKDWNSHPEEWAQFVEYCRQDVEAERAVYHAAVALNCPMTDEEHEAWLLDQRMNKTGVFIDQQYVTNAKKLAETESDLILAEIKSHTGLDNPNSRNQLIEWCQARKYPYDSLDKEHIEEALKSGTQLPPLLRTVLELKQKLGGSAYKKLESILERMGIDGRLRDQFIYHGAHTGRWAGRGVQLQNLFKPNKDVSKFLDTYTRAIRLGKKIISRNSQMALVASTIRSSFAATPGHRLVVGDLAQIESRCLAVVAKCLAMMDAYAAGRDLYKECMASQLGKSIEDVDSGERARGKIIILGCGYQMGWEHFMEFAATYGVILEEQDAKDAVYGFRGTYKEIPALWAALNSAVIRAVKAGMCVFVNGLVVDGRDPRVMKIKLPSGRSLHYFNPRVIIDNKWGRPMEAVIYTQYDSKGSKTSSLYGGLLTENVIQAMSRDILLNGMFEAEKEGFKIIMTIHDEIVAEVPIDSPLGIDKLLECMRRTPWWAEGMGFTLAAEGYEGAYYKK
jgi:DNA polymerase